MKELNLDEIKKIQIDILDYVDDFCKKNNIRYFLSGGTLIGAVRHKGYIPWDDDIDIMMLRDDYDCFISLFANCDTYPYILYSNGTPRDYPLPFAKIANDNTLIKENVIDSFDIGINIDLFPLDSIPDDKTKQLNLYSVFNLYRKVYFLKQLKWSKDRAVLKNVFLIISRYLLKIISYSFLSRRLYKNAIKYKCTNSRLCGNAVWGYGIREIVEKKCFHTSLYGDFEGKQYPIPVGYDDYLKNLYGNYMKYPPEDKRKSPHTIKAYKK